MAFRISWHSGDGSGVSLETQVMDPACTRSRRRMRLGRSIASSRQSSIVWRTRG